MHEFRPYVDSTKYSQCLKFFFVCLEQNLNVFVLLYSNMQCETNHETKEIILQRGPWKRGVGGVGDPKCSKKERCFKRCQRAFERIHEVIFNLSQYLKSCKRFTILSPYMDCSCRIGFKLSESENFATLDIDTNESFIH